MEPNDDLKPKDESEHTFKTIDAKPVELDDNFDYFGQKWHTRILSKILVFVAKIVFVYIYGFLFLRFRVRNKHIFKAYRHKGAVIVSNHVHQFDSFLLGASFFPKRIYYTMLKTNLGLPIVGKLFHIVGGAPIPDTKVGILRYQTLLNEQLQNNNMIAVFPEAALRPYCDHIRPFKKGAFRFAFNANVDIIPMVFIFKKPTGLYKYLKRKPCVELHILSPYQLKHLETKYETLSYNTEELQKIITAYYNTHSDYVGGN